MPRKTDMTKGSSLDGKTKGARGVKGIPQGVGGQPVSGTSKARNDVGWPGVQDSSLGPDDVVKSAK